MPPTGSVGAEVLQSALIVNGAVPDEIITPSARENVVSWKRPTPRSVSSRAYSIA